MLKKSRVLSVAARSTSFVKDAITDEIMKVSIKLLMGLIISSLVILSIVIVGQQVNAMLIQMPSGPILSIVSFAIVAVLGISTLVYMFKSESTLQQPILEPAQNPSLNFKKILAKFYEGLLDGLEKRPRTIRNQVLSSGNDKPIPRVPRVPPPPHIDEFPAFPSRVPYQ